MHQMADARGGIDRGAVPVQCLLDDVEQARDERSGIDGAVVGSLQSLVAAKLAVVDQGCGGRRR
jgi:hypothetical protein